MFGVKNVKNLIENVLVLVILKIFGTGCGEK